MLTLKQIKLAINEILIENFPDIEVQSTDVRKGFKRPSFFVQLDTQSRDSGQFVSNRSMIVRIYYFPSDRYEYSLEILEMQDDLENVFSLNFAVQDRVITIDETRAQKVDGVLEFEIDFEFTDKSAAYKDDSDKELMEVLHYGD